VTQGSCTAAFPYWSSTSYAATPVLAWDVDFKIGNVLLSEKRVGRHVRAVRGGL
jgi:hypothetical protein